MNSFIFPGLKRGDDSTDNDLLPYLSIPETDLSLKTSAFPFPGPTAVAGYKSS
ncbi:MAG: hypothetical protein ACKOX3_07595 [Bacteroidota bacterium]